MLADLLADAIAQIEHCLDAWPPPAPDWEPDVRAWLSATATLRRNLENPMWYHDYQTGNCHATIPLEETR